MVFLSRKQACLIALAVVVMALPARAQTLNWGTGGLGGSGTWDNGTSANWNNGSDVVWSGGNTAVFGGTTGTIAVSGTIAGVNGMTFNTTGYVFNGGTITLTGNTVTVGSGLTETINSVLTGTVGLNLTGGGTLILNNAVAGANSLSGAYTIGTGSTLVIGDQFAAVGNAVAVNGTLDLASAGVFNTGRNISNLTGNGVITSLSSTAGGALRVRAGSFSGTIQDGGSTAKRTSVLFDTASGLLTLSGTNTYTGDTLIREGGILRLGSAGALPANSLLRLESGSTSTLEMTSASGDLTRAIANVSGAGGISFTGGNSYFSAVGADRNVTLTGTLTWGTAPFNPAILGFGSVNGTNKVTWISPFSMGNANRTIDVIDSAAAIDAEFAGTITGGGTSSGFFKTGNGTLLISAPANVAALRLKAGTTIIGAGVGAGGSYTGTAFSSIGVATNDNATLTLTGSAFITAPADFNVSDVAATRGVLNMQSTGTVAVNNTYIGKTSAIGFLNIASGTLNVNGILYVGSTGTAVGVVTQTGGTITAPFAAPNGNEWAFGGSTTGNTAAYGYYNLSAGNFTPTTAVQFGRYGLGVLDMSGGTVTIGSWVDAGRYSTGNGVINLRGGTFTQNTAARLLFVGEDGTGLLNVFSGATFNANGGVIVGNTATANGIFNLIGGTANLQTIGKNNATAVGRLYINGGLLRPVLANATWIQNLSSATVGPAGANIENNVDVAITQALLTPTGSGLSTTANIPVLTGGAGYYGPPIVTLTGGGGTGASAIAIMTNGVLTGLTITNPGNGYSTAPTVTLSGGSPTTAATFGVPTLIANSIDGGLTKTGTGVLTLSGASTLLGATTITAGTLAIPTFPLSGVAGPLGAQSTAAGLVFNGGALRYTGASTSTDRRFTINAGKIATFDVSTAATNLTLNGVAPTTAEGITKTGSGVLTLGFSSPGNYTGTTRASGGILAASGSLSGPLVVNSGGRINAVYQAVGALGVPTLTFNAGSGIDFDFGTGNDLITVANASGLSLTSAISLNLYQAGGNTAFTTNGTYPLIAYNTGFTGTLNGAFAVTNSQPGKVYSIANNAGTSTIELTIGSSVTTAWNIDGGGSWPVDGNWTAGAPNSIGALVTFGTVLANNSPAVVTVDGPKTVGNLIFSSPLTYNLTGTSGDILTVNNGIGSAIVTATAGTHSIGVPVVLANPTTLNADTGASLTISGNISGAASVTKTGVGTVVLSGSNSYTGATLISAGTLEIGNAAGLTNTPSLTVRTGTTFRTSAAGTTFAGPLTLDLNGGTSTGISGGANGTGNYQLDVTTGSSLSVSGLFNNNGGSLVKLGGGTLTLTNGGTQTLSSSGGISLVVQNGTLVLNGGPTAVYNITGEVAIGDNTPNAATLTVASGTLNANSYLSISRGNGTLGLTSTFSVTGGTANVLNLFNGYNNGVANYSTNPTILVSGSGVINATNATRFAENAGANAYTALTGSATIITQNNVEIGYGGKALVSVGAGTTFNANQYLFGNAANGVGALWNRGTIIVRSGASTNHFAIGNAAGAYGYYLHDTSVATTLQEVGIGGAGNGNGVLEVFSGNLNIAAYVTPNRGTLGTNAMILVAGGTLTPPNIAGRFAAGFATATVAQYTVIDVGAGGRIAGGASSDINLLNTAFAGHQSSLTIHDGGIVDTTRIYANAAGITSVNFNNGILRATAGTNLLDNNLARVTIHDGGMTVDSNGFNVTLGNNALLAPVGTGITSIPLLSGGAGYIGRPIVNITDPTGTGATAVANFDPTTGVLLSITMTSPGSNYTSPTITLVGGGATTPANFDVPVFAAAAGTGGLTKLGSGILTLSNGNSTYGGNTLISAGTLLVTNATGSATSTGTVTLSSTATLAGTGTIAGPVVLASGTILAPGTIVTGNSVVGNLTVGSLTLTAGSIINQQITDSLTLDRLTVTNTDGLTINGGGYNLLKTTDNSLFATNGVYNLISYAGNIGGTGVSSLSVLNPQTGKAYNFDTNAGFVTLTIATIGGVANFWNIDANGAWTPGANWTLNSAPNGVSNFANFGGGGTPITAARTVTLDANQTVGTIAFNSANAFTIAGTNTLTLNNGVDPNAQVTVTLGNHILDVPLNAVSANTQFNVLNATDSLTVSKAFSGTTNVSKLGAGLLTLSGTNTFVGSTTLASGTLELVGSAAIGGTTTLNVSGATVLRLSGATNVVNAPIAFSLGGDTAHAASGAANGTANYIIDVSPGTTATINGLITTTSGSFMKTGAGSLTIAGSGTNVLANVGGLAYTLQNGSITFAGSGATAYTIGGEFTIGDNTPNAVTATLTGGTLNVSSYTSIGRGNGTTGLQSTLNVTGGTLNTVNLFTGYGNGVAGYNAQPVINISGNGVVNATGTGANQGVRISESGGSRSTLNVSGSGTLTSSGDFQIGYGGVAAVNISGNAYVAFGNLGLGYGAGSGIITQTGGILQQTGGYGNDWRIGGYNAGNVNAYGAYTLTAGTMNSGGRNIQIGAYGAGVLDVSGTGSYTSTGGYPVVGRYVGGNGLVNVSGGGTFTQGNTGTVLIIGEEGTGVFNVLGGTVIALGGTTQAGVGGGTGGVRLANLATGNGTLNLNGGTLTTTGITKYNATGLSYVSLNGGTVLASTANPNFFVGHDYAVVGAGNAIFDTNGFDITIAQPLTAPTGQGVATIPVLDGGAGYLGQPIVKIVGDGTGATAVATMSGGIVTGITITNPGINYSSATITLLGGGATTIASLDAATFTTTATTGGLIKNGFGTLTLAGVNSYGGDTVVNAGTLKMGAGNIMPNGVNTGTLSVASTFDLNGFDQTINGLTGSGIVDTTSGGNANLTLGGNDATRTFNGSIRNTSGVLSLTKIGSGNQTLNGINTYTGPTTVNAGTLTLNGSLAVGSAVTVNGSALIAGSGAIRDSVTYSSSGTSTFGGNISGSGSLTMNGTGELVLSGFNTFSGPTTVSSGKLTLLNSLSGPGGSITIADDATLQASGVIQRDIAVNGANQSGTIKAVGNLVLINNSGGITFDGHLNTQGNFVQYATVGDALVRSLSLSNGALLTTGTAIKLANNPQGNNLDQGSTGVAYIDGSVTIGGVFWAGRVSGDSATVVGAGNSNGDNVTFTGVLRGSLAAFGVNVTIEGLDREGWSPTFSPIVGANFNSGATVVVANTTTQYSPVAASSPPDGTGGGHTQRLVAGYIQNSVSHAGTYTVTGTTSYSWDSTPGSGSHYVASTAVKGDAFTFVRTDGSLWGTVGGIQFIDGSIVNSSLVTLPNGISSGNGGSFQNLPALPSGLFWHVDATPKHIQLYVGGYVPFGSGVWKNGSGDQNWTTNSAADNNWGTAQPFAAGQIATFDGSVANFGNGVVNVDAPQIIGGIALNRSPGSYNIGTNSGFGITLDNGTSDATISGINGSHTIAAPITLASNLLATVTNSSDTLTLSGGVVGTGKSLTKAGAGTLVLGGANNYTGATNINAGTLAVNNSLYGPGGTITIADNATLAAAGSFQRAVAVSGANQSGTIKATGNLTFVQLNSGLNFNGHLNVQGNVVQFATQGDALVRSLSLSNGALLTTGTAIKLANNPNGDNLDQGTTGVAYIDGSVTIGGVFWAGRVSGNSATVVGAGNPNGDNVTFTGVLRGSLAAFGVNVTIDGLDREGWSPAFSPIAGGNFNAGATVLSINNTNQYTPNVGTNLTVNTTSGGHTQRLAAGYIINGVTTNGTYTVPTVPSYSWAADSTYNANAAVKGDTFTFVRTDGALWGTSGTRTYIDGSIINFAAVVLPNGTTGGSVGSFSNLPTLPGGFFWHVDATAKRLALYVGGFLPYGTGTWRNGSADQSYSTNSAADSNWGTAQPFFAGNIATFDSSVINYANGVVNVDAAPTMGGMVFNRLAGGYTLNGGGITLNNLSSPATITVSNTGGTLSAGSHAVNSNLTLVSNLAVAVDNALDTLTLGGSSTGAGKSVTKTGAGSLVFSGAAGHTGTTIVTGGTVGLTGVGSFAASPLVTLATGTTLSVAGVTGGANFDGARFGLASGQTLRGTGTVAGNTAVRGGATIGAGNGSIGTLAVTGNLVVTGTIQSKVSTGPDLADLINVSGTVSLLPGSILDLPTTNTYAAAGQYILVQSTGLSGTFSSVTNVPSGYSVDYGTIIPNAIVLSAVPEPGAMLFVAGLIGAAATFRRRRA